MNKRKKMEQDGQVLFLRILRKFRSNGRKFRTCPEVPNIPGKSLKSKFKIKFFEMLLQFLSRELMMIKIKTLEFNLVKKKTKLQYNGKNFFHTQECTKAFNTTIRSTTF